MATKRSKRFNSITLTWRCSLEKHMLRHTIGELSVSHTGWINLQSADHCKCIRVEVIHTVHIGRPPPCSTGVVRCVFTPCQSRLSVGISGMSSASMELSPPRTSLSVREVSPRQRTPTPQKHSAVEVEEDLLWTCPSELVRPTAGPPAAGSPTAAASCVNASMDNPGSQQRAH